MPGKSIIVKFGHEFEYIERIIGMSFMFLVD